MMRLNNRALNRVPIHLTVPVWGESFLNLFLNFVLPSYLCDGGIPELNARGLWAKFFLYTKFDDEKYIRNHFQFKRLQKLINVELLFIDKLIDISNHQNQYETMNSCHTDFISRSEAVNAGMFFYSPDAFWSSGSMRFSLNQIEKGSRAILIAGVRAEKEAALEFIKGQVEELRTNGISSFNLVELLINFPHRITKSLTYSSKDFDIGWPSHLYWKIRNEGYLARCFHLHTFFVYPRLKGRPELAHDFDWLSKIGLNDDEIYIVQNSNEICAVELSNRDRSVNGNVGIFSVLAVARWLAKYGQPDHLKYVLQPIRFHGKKTHFISWTFTIIESWIVIKFILIISNILKKENYEK